MKSAVKIFWIAALLAMTGCSGDMDFKTSSKGANYEIAVIASQPKWDGEAGDTLRSIFNVPVMMINSDEPIFDLISFPPTAYNNFVKRHRNIISIRTGEEFNTPKTTIQVDNYAAPQLVVEISAPDDKSLVEYISGQREVLVELFSTAEQERYLSSIERHNQPALNDEIGKKFGFDMKVPLGYRMRNQRENFMWLSHNLPLAYQDVVIYSRPYTGVENFEAASLIKARDEFVSLIPGPSDGSYMITVTEYEPMVEYMRIGTRMWAIMRGFWDVKNDFMGGPFVSYSTLDAAENRIVTLDNFIYSPHRPKRNLLRELEVLVHTVEFPEDTQ